MCAVLLHELLNEIISKEKVVTNFGTRAKVCPCCATGLLQLGISESVLNVRFFGDGESHL